MNWLDVAAAAGLAAFALRGLLKGLVAESLGFLGLVLAAAGSLYAYPTVAGALRRAVSMPRPLAVLSAALVVFLAAEFVWLLGVYFLVGRGGKDGFRRSGADRVGGALFGAGKGLVLVSFALLLLESLPLPGAYRATAEEAEFAARLRAVAPWVGDHVAAVLPLAARRHYESFRGEVRPLGARWSAVAPPPHPTKTAPGPSAPAPPAASQAPAKQPPPKMPSSLEGRKAS
jgi:membrane protein required for colicin V production